MTFYVLNLEQYDNSDDGKFEYTYAFDYEDFQDWFNTEVYPQNYRLIIMHNDF